MRAAAPEALELSGGSTDVAMQAYHTALMGALPALELASVALQGLLSSRASNDKSTSQSEDMARVPGASSPPSCLPSFPPSAPDTTSTIHVLSVPGTTSLKADDRPSRLAPDVGETLPRPPSARARPRAFACDRFSILACFCWPIFIAQLWQRQTRARSGCACSLLLFLCLVMMLSLVLIGNLAWNSQTPAKLDTLAFKVYPYAYRPAYRALLPNSVRSPDHPCTARIARA